MGTGQPGRHEAVIRAAVAASMRATEPAKPGGMVVVAAATGMVVFVVVGTARAVIVGAATGGVVLVVVVGVTVGGAPGRSNAGTAAVSGRTLPASGS